MITNYPQGLFIHALSWTTPQHEAVLCSSTATEAQLAEQAKLVAPPINFDMADGVPRLACLDNTDGQPAPLSLQVMRASGVPRARSAARCTVFAALVAKALRTSLADALQASSSLASGDEVGIAVVSNSATVQIFFQFESVGVSRSWKDTDAMLLPASIPSAGCTAASMVTDSHASAVTFGDGLYGVCAALEHAQLLFHHGRARHLLLLATEEANAPMARALATLGDLRAVYDGCAGLLLSSQPLAPSDWQLAALAIIPEGGTVRINAPWLQGSRVRVHLDNPLSAFTSQLLPLALHEAMRFGVQSGHTTALVEFHVAGRGSVLMALQRPSQQVQQDVAGPLSRATTGSPTAAGMQPFA